jgi:hypothetical protein
MLPLSLLLCRSQARLNGVTYLLFKENKRRNERHQHATKNRVDQRGQNLRKRAAMFEREETIDERYRLSKSRLGDSLLSGWQANISSSGSNRRSQVARSRKKELKGFYERIPPGIESFSRKRAEMRGNMSNLSSAIPPSRGHTWITRAA